MGMFGGLGDALGAVNPAAVFGTGLSLGSGVLSYMGQESANRTNREIAENQMNFQQMMSNTAYQRAVASMEAAGLNPMLAYQQGGASTPQGATTQVGNSLGAGVNSAVAGASLMGDLARKASEINQLDASAKKTDAEADLTRVLTTKAGEDVHVSTATAARIKEETDNLIEERRRIMADVGLKDAQTATEGARRLNISGSSVLQKQTFEQNAEMFPQLLKLKQIENRLQALRVPKGEVEAGFYSGAAGQVSPYVDMLKEVLGGAVNARRAGLR